MTSVASPVSERYPRGLQAWGDVAAGVCNGPRLGGSVRSSGFPLHDSHGNPGDRCLATDDEIHRFGGCRASAEKRIYRTVEDQFLTRSSRPNV